MMSAEEPQTMSVWERSATDAQWGAIIHDVGTDYLHVAEKTCLLQGRPTSLVEGAASNVRLISGPH